MKKRLFSLIMVLILSFVSVNEVRADAGSLIIAGGSVAGGIAAGAFAGPAVVAVFCAMIAFGMNVELTEASEEAGMTKTEFLKNKIQEYCTEAKISANTFNEYVLDQAQVLEDGRITITKKAGQVIEKFCNWLFANEEVVSPSTGTISSVVVNGITCPVVQPGQTYDLGTYKNTNVYSIYNQGTKPLALCAFKINYQNRVWYDIALFTNESSTFSDFELTFYTKDQGNYKFYDYTNLVNGNYIIDAAFIDSTQSANIEIPFISDTVFNSPTTNAYEWFGENAGEYSFGGTVTGDNITGDMDDYDVSKGVLNPTQDQTIVINPNITIPVPQDKDVSIDVNTYIEAIQDLIDGLKDDLIEAIDTATDTPITIEFDPTQDWDPTIEDEDDSELPPIEDRTPVVKDDIIPHDFDPDPMKFDLKGIFPFCIPWDIKDMLNKLSADPVAPSYTVNWMIPIVNERLIFTVDLAPFNGVAQVCRTMELLAFCIGLAVVTRQLFLRG